ncbi:MAG: ASKHA domain-containing protein [Verrucomicrobiota bacterium]
MNLTIETAKGRQLLTVTDTERALRLSDLLRRKHFPLNTRCGQRGLCDGCVIELLAGHLTNMATGETIAGTGQAVRGCEYRLAHDGPVTMRIPPRSLLAYEPQVVSEFKTNVPRAHDPLWQQVAIPANGLAGIQRRRPLRSAVELPAGAVATLEYRCDHWLVTGVSTTPEPQPLGVAVDIGTTTVALLVCDLRDGRVLAGAANFNRQMHLGDDVLTRINLCSTDPTQLKHLQDLIIEETLKPLLNEALGKVGATLAQVRCMTVAANTTMLHLFAGIDPSSMGLAPFTATFLEHRLVTVPGWPFTIHLLPGAAAYVGADLTAGAFATGLVYDEGPSLLVDVGTNGEIILKRGQHLSGCATAAGPAFEGAGLTNGVRATDGAIAHIKLEGNPFAVTIEKIGQEMPIGLCGTAYVDFLADGRAADLLNERGRFTEAFTEQTMPWKDYGRALRVATGIGKSDIVVTEVDIAGLLQAKAAIAAGILTLLERSGLTPAQIKKLYLAGGFGLHLNRVNAIACGLLPGFVPEQIEVVGNTSLAGAYLALLDCGALDEIAKAGKKMDVVELNLDAGFEDRYIEQLSLP